MYKSFLVLLAVAPLSACVQPTASDGSGIDGARLIARAHDSALVNTDTLDDKLAAVAVLPDGCQAWLMDDGAEGYADNRYDPDTGLPHCPPGLPPGAVIGHYKTNGFIDILP
jgi:hypothetical protein